jgi:hypothetical protein
MNKNVIMIIMLVCYAIGLGGFYYFGINSNGPMIAFTIIFLVVVSIGGFYLLGKEK